uniref:FCP1 homology domain-containing protein n=1 Tax=Oryza punctata TaxID=4537 RepID=A0A0E0LID6_ORYPU
MQTRKKGATKNALGDPANTKTSRQPRRAAQAAASEKKVNDLITSSAKKKKSVGAPSKKNRASKGGRKLISPCDAANAENEVSQVVSGIPHDQKQSDDNVDGRPCDSIFSPAYHLQKECGASNFAKAPKRNMHVGELGEPWHGRPQRQYCCLRLELHLPPQQLCDVDVGEPHLCRRRPLSYSWTPPSLPSAAVIGEIGGRSGGSEDGPVLHAELERRLCDGRDCVERREGLEHKGDTLGSVGSVEERTTHAQGRQEVTNIRSESTSHAVKTCVGSDHHALNAQSAFCNTPLEEDEFSELGNLSSEVSAIYLAMQQSKLECIDEHSQDSISTEGYVDPEDTEEYDDFDPFAFIKDLPDLSLVVPKFRPVLLPKQTRSCPTTTLVLDLDETLVHSTLEPCEDADFAFPVYFNFREHTIYVRCRPYLKEFLERVASLFETIIFTASQSIYAEQLLNVLDPKRKLFRHRVYRDSCVYVEGNYLKDLTVLGRDLTRIMIVDNSPQAFGFQLDNGIPIESWFDDPNDQELLKLLPFLESLVGVEDVRPYIARKFNLREKVATASSLPMDLQM